MLFYCAMHTLVLCQNDSSIIKQSMMHDSQATPLLHQNLVKWVTQTQAANIPYVL